jgi:serine/threonine-protein kinase HipA
VAAQILHVLLNALPVGTLSLSEEGRCEFRLSSSYRQAHPRPVLGQRFLDDLEGSWQTRARVPSWFSNLLPEGQLRDLIARQAGVHVDREFFLLRHLGEDLPGAVRIVPEDAVVDGMFGAIPEEEVERTDDDVWHFSLAGVQLKFSAQRQGRGLTIPVRGQNGDWLVKLPAVMHPAVPENEHATMRWASLSGIDVPETALIPIGDIEGLPEDVAQSLREPLAYAVRRFDRPQGQPRVHMEDFAQLLDLYPEQKYDKYSYETIARIVLALTGEPGLRQFLRRLVFVVVSGNGDAHHKNWSLLYPDGLTAVLSPAYDFVSTIAYQPTDRLALNLARSKDWASVSLDSFQRLARKLDIDAEVVLDEVKQASADIREVWHSSRGDLGYSQALRNTLDQHMSELPLLRL